MTNLNLNLDLFITDEGYMGASIYALTAINSEDERETLGYFSSKDKAEKDLDFWTQTMGYRDAKIDTHVLRF